MTSSSFFCASLPSQHAASLTCTFSNPAGVHQDTSIKKKGGQKPHEKKHSKLLSLISQSNSGSRFVQVAGSTHFEGCDCFLKTRLCQINCKGFIVLFCFFFSSLLSKSGQAALGLNTSKKKTHIGSGSLFCGALEENILSPLCKTNTNSLLAWTLFFVDTLL